jgi:hypothetical protein
VPVRLKVTNEIVEAAIELIDRRWGGLISADTMLDRLLQQGFQKGLRKWIDEDEDRERLEAIVEGQRKWIDARWWISLHAVDQERLDKLRRLADPKLNDNEHERRAAEAKLRELENRCDVKKG